VFANVNGAVAEQSATTGTMIQNAAATSDFIVGVASSAGEIDSAAREAEAFGSRVADAGHSVSTLVDKLKSRCAVLLKQNDPDRPRKDQRLPCHLRITLQPKSGEITGGVFELARETVLVSAERLTSCAVGAVVPATIDGLGACRLAVVAHDDLGSELRFVDADAALRDRIEDALFAIHDSSTECIARAMDAGGRIARLFEDAVARRSISLADLFDTDYVPIAGSNPPQFRTRYLDWADQALPAIQEAVLATDSTMAFCAAVDRNGYLPVHNRIYSHPQRPGDEVWNTANCRNRRIFNDPAGLAAARNTRAYLMQSYPRDMGNGVKIRMREIDVPIRVAGQHWGGFRTAYKL
jgi:methyl-accepting chemotaxis protein